MKDKCDDMSEALMRRRKDFSSKSMDDKEVSQNKDMGAISPKGATPEMALPGAVPGLPVGDALAPEGMGGTLQAQGEGMQLTPEMLIEILGSMNAGGLRGRVIDSAQAMKK